MCVGGGVAALVVEGWVGMPSLECLLYLGCESRSTKSAKFIVTKVIGFHIKTCHQFGCVCALLHQQEEAGISKRLHTTFTGLHALALICCPTCVPHPTEGGLLTVAAACVSDVRSTHQPPASDCIMQKPPKLGSKLRADAWRNGVIFLVEET
ncbi:unnamed protein product [Ostreobium quekettii]|uniref:Uncharacterized protein n=1 Tax=Ostreobium quekettii TaxID=121088 RepID=A0A8S1IPL8_9CHLO|nr:unnamed protein product [Ostreobium quekettii]